MGVYVYMYVYRVRGRPTVCDRIHGPYVVVSSDDLDNRSTPFSTQIPINVMSLVNMSLSHSPRTSRILHRVEQNLLTFSIIT